MFNEPSLLWQFQTESDKPKLLHWIQSPIKSLPLISTGAAIWPLLLLSWLEKTNLARWVVLLPPDWGEARALALLWWPHHRICWDVISIEPGWGCFCGIKLSQGKKKGYLLCTSQHQNFSLNSCGLTQHTALLSEPILESVFHKKDVSPPRDT